MSNTWTSGTEDGAIRQRRRLFQALMVSGILNVMMATYMVYNMVKEDGYDLPRRIEAASSKALTIDGAVKNFKTMPLDALIAKLSDTKAIEDGYKVRDIALATLVSYKDFDLSRALLGQPQPTQQRKMILEDKSELTVFPGLSDTQYVAIGHFATTEKWPLTSRGLFTMVQQAENRKDATLLETFFLTPEFLAVEMLFNRANPVVDKAELLDLVTSGDWQIVSQFARKQQKAQDLSPERREALLLEYLSCGSKPATYLLLKTDEAFASKKLDDATVVMVLKTLDGATPQAESFAKTMLTSKRSDSVYQAAAECLYRWAGEAMPLPYDHAKALARFAPTPSPKEAFAETPSRKTPPTATSKPKTTPKAATQVVAGSRKYTVQKGDSLWKVSRKYHVSVDSIKKANSLKSDNLSPGSTLTIPER